MGVHCAACQIREPTTADKTSVDQEQIHSTRCSMMTEPGCSSADDLGSRSESDKIFLGWLEPAFYFSSRYWVQTLTQNQVFFSAQVS